MSDITKILAKVRALRELAKSSNLNEATAAAARADALIQQYQLEEAELSTAPEQGEPIREHAEPVWAQRERPFWRSILCNVLAHHYGCSSWTDVMPGEYTGRIVGRASDVAIVRYMFAWSASEIVRLSRGEVDRKDRPTFCRGAVDGFAHALFEAKEKTQADYKRAHGDGAAMVLVSRALASQKERDRLHPDLTSGHGPRVNRGRDAYAAGYASGKTLQPKSGLPGASGVLMLGKGKR